MSSADRPNREVLRRRSQPRARPHPGNVRHEPVIALSAELVDRLNVRVLDPADAVQVPGQPRVKSTAYIGDRLIVSGGASDDTRSALAQAAIEHDLSIVVDVDAGHLRTAELARRLRVTSPTMFAETVRLVAGGSTATKPPDAWRVLQSFRALVGRDDPGQRHVALDHLMILAPYVSGSPYVNASRIGEYAVPGWGGRAPVAWIGPAPARRADKALACRRPVVAVLDTGVGEHPWLTPDVVRRDASVLGVPIGVQASATDPERTRMVTDPLGGLLDSDSGHGTFIAGLVRQSCPDADILAISVMAGDGGVAESDLLDTLNLLALRQLVAQAEGNAGDLVDVLTLSLGYYHEQPDDLTYDPQLLGPLQVLSDCGVAVVFAAGNDCTARPMYPAAFSPHPGGLIKAPQRNCPPMISVGALNPDGSVAMFSNAGPWVACHRSGAALVSTFPVTFNAALQPALRTWVDGDGWRETIDPDDFSGGFGTWSGTSFAAPILGAQLAMALLDNGCGPLDAPDRGSMVARAWTAVTRCVGVVRP
ncbi:MAG: S8/S53 family peptidase [Actinomycetota bacterium]|nr:S8/S53 family peptidase [Actinomycetota bacterium]